MANAHICDVTIHWPDGKWDEQTEKEYLVHCLRRIADALEIRQPALPDEKDMYFLNALGRTYATVKLSKAKE